MRCWFAAISIVLASAGACRAQIAIALNPTTGKAAGYNGSWDAEAVKRQALSMCGSDCRIVATGKGTCAAVVESISTGGSVWAVGYGTTIQTASQNGWHECRRRGGVNCNTAVALCD